jgi:hypothetical protein
MASTLASFQEEPYAYNLASKFDLLYPLEEIDR